MKDGEAVAAVVIMILVCVALGFWLRWETLDYEEDCHIYRYGPEKEARQCKLQYKDYMKGKK